MKIGNKKVGPNHKPFIIVDVGANHNGDIELAKETIVAAAEIGCDAVKFQSWSKFSLFSKSLYQESKFEEELDQVTLSKDAHKILAKTCKENNIMFMSTPFCKEEVDLLDDLEIPAFKIASCDLNNLDLIEYICKKKKPIILSTGMANLEEVKKSVNLIKSHSIPIIVLHCVAIYPTPPELANLPRIKGLEKELNTLVGFSDHTTTTTIPIASIAYGACVIEKHFTLDKKIDTMDKPVSLNPSEMKIIVKGSEEVWKANRHHLELSQNEQGMRDNMRRSIVAKQKIKIGEVFSEDNLTAKRPGTGIPANKLYELFNKTSKNNYRADALIFMDELL